jgi:hypothetical protein
VETADTTRNVLSVPTSVRGRLTVPAIVLALPSFLGCSRPASMPRNAIIVAIDALRADYLAATAIRPKSPHIDTLAAGGTRFANGISHDTVDTALDGDDDDQPVSNGPWSDGPQRRAGVRDVRRTVTP